VHVCMSIARASRVLCVIHWFAMHSPLPCSATLATLAQAEHSCGSGQRHLPPLISDPFLARKGSVWVHGSELRKQRTPRWNARCVDAVTLATRHVVACVHSCAVSFATPDKQAAAAYYWLYRCMPCGAPCATRHRFYTIPFYYFKKAVSCGGRWFPNITSALRKGTYAHRFRRGR
jgi:hypothetical protein